MVDYLKQRGLRTMFLTDTEVTILVFDYLSRVHNYPLEYIIEALAPTTEMDFDQLPKAKQEIYRKIQIAHMHGSPDGPWFFDQPQGRGAGSEPHRRGLRDPPRSLGESGGRGPGLGSRASHRPAAARHGLPLPLFGSLLELRHYGPLMGQLTLLVPRSLLRPPPPGSDAEDCQQEPDEPFSDPAAFTLSSLCSHRGTIGNSYEPRCQ